MKYWRITKVLIPPGIALFIATVGWMLTEKFNTTQLEVSKQRNSSELEVARINAALRYIEFLRSAPEPDPNLTNLAITIAAPVLPPEIAFGLAVDLLPEDTSALNTLVAKYGDEAYRHLVTNLEVPFTQIKDVHFSIHYGPLDPPKQSSEEKRSRNVFRYLRERQLAEHFFQFLISENYNNARFRPIVLLFYFENYRDSLKSSNQSSESVIAQNRRIQREFHSHMSNVVLSGEVKRAIALSASIAFAHRDQGEDNSVISKGATEHFWAGFNLTGGAAPQRNTIDGYVYENIIGYDRKRKRDANTTEFQLGIQSSKNLRNAILDLNFLDLDMNNISSLLYAYAQSPTISGSSSYLVPTDTVVVMRRILEWADTEKKRMELSMELGSIGGERLFRNLLPKCFGCSKSMRKEEIEKRCAAAKTFGNMLSSWYRENHSEDWYIPKFFHSVVYEFPELLDKIDGKAWGVGNIEFEDRRCLQ